MGVFKLSIFISTHSIFHFTSSSDQVMTGHLVQYMQRLSLSRTRLNRQHRAARSGQTRISKLTRQFVRRFGLAYDRILATQWRDAGKVELSFFIDILVWARAFLQIRSSGKLFIVTVTKSLGSIRCITCLPFCHTSCVGRKAGVPNCFYTAVRYENEKKINGPPYFFNLLNELEK